MSLRWNVNFLTFLPTHDRTISIKTPHPIKSTQIMSVSIALPSPETERFNLRQEEFALPTEAQLLKQLLVACFLVIALFGSFTAYTILQIHALKSEAAELESETVAEIKERFTKIDDTQDDLEDVIEAARTEVQEQERLLSAFLRSPSSSALNYLLELTTRLDPQALGLQMKQITITENKIIFSARVRDYDALKILEYDLSQSPLFKNITPQEDPDFTMEITLAQRKSNGTR